MQTSIHAIETQDKIIQVMSSNVHTWGWTPSCIEQAGITLGFSQQDAGRAFQGDLSQAFHHIFDLIDREMKENLESVDLTPQRIHNRIHFLIALRLKLFLPFRPLLIKALSHPTYSLSYHRSLKKFFSTINKIWYTAGDQATDFNYYTKRFLLSGVYGSTFLFWLQDTSNDFEKTNTFLQKRIDQVMKISKWLCR